MLCILTLVLLITMEWFSHCANLGTFRCTISLAADKSSYRIGEPIILELEFIGGEPGYSVNITKTELASPIDELVLSPKTGVRV
jgi:uncharacterized membrane protein YsdA (DUF1294 family)